MRTLSVSHQNEIDRPMSCDLSAQAASSAVGEVATSEDKTVKSGQSMALSFALFDPPDEQPSQ